MISASVEDVPVVAPRQIQLSVACIGSRRPSEGMRLTERGGGVELAYRGGGWTSGLVRANELLVGGEKVVGIRQPAIANAVDGSVVDSQLRAVVGELLAAMREHGLIAT